MVQKTQSIKDYNSNLLAFSHPDCFFPICIIEYHVRVNLKDILDFFVLFIYLEHFRK